MPSFTSNNATIAYDIVGTGAPVLMLAGIASDMASWTPLLPYLQNNFQLIRMDNRGTGQTLCPKGTITIDTMLADGCALLDHLGLQRVSIIGHSMGGMLALNLAHRQPGRVRRIVAIAAGAFPDPKSRQLLDDLANLDRAQIDRRVWFRLLFQFLFTAPLFADPDQLAAAVEASLAYPHLQSRENFIAQVDAIKTLRPINAAEIAAPILAIAGEKDILMPADIIAQGLAGHGALHLDTIPNAGHAPHWDAPNAVAKIARAFLRGDAA